MSPSIYQLQQIETPRLLIRPVQLGDEFPLHESIERSQIELEKWMPWAKNTTFSATENFIHRAVEHWQKRTSKDFPLLVLHKESQKVISVSGFNEHTDLERPCFEIGYWIDSTFARQGLATELVNALTRYALQGLHAIRAQICTQVANTKSTAVAERCAYDYEGKIKNICLDCTSRLPEDGLLFSCCDISKLPALDVTWKQLSEASKTEEISEEKTEPKAMLRNAETQSVIQLKRLCLRAPRIQDTDKLYMALMPSLNEVGPWFSWAHKDLTRRQLQVQVDKAAAASVDVLAAEHLFFLVWDRDRNNVLGEIWFKVVDWAVPNLQIMYWFDFRNIGNHDAFDAISAVVRYAFAKRNAKCIQLYLPENNARHTKLARRLGFQLEGRLKNYFKNYVTNEISSAEMFSMTEFSQLKKNN